MKTFWKVRMDLNVTFTLIAMVPNGSRTHLPNRYFGIELMNVKCVLDPERQNNDHSLLKMGLKVRIL